MTVISKGAVLKKKVGSDVYIYQPYTHIDFVEGGLDQAEIENLINSAGYLDASAVNAILESYYTKDEVEELIALNEYVHPSSHPASMITGLSEVAIDGKFASLTNKPTSLNGYGITDAYTKTEVDNKVKANSDAITTLQSGKADKATTLAGYGITNAYTKTEVDNKVTTINNSITTTVNTHNSNTSAHSDIRNLISDLANRLNALANSDDTTLDQMAEVVAYIKSNRGLIEGITTTKANKDYVDTELAKKANSSSLATVATSGSYNDLSNKPTIPTTLPANGGNADTVGGFTVGVNVPANAKFTDTTYTAMTASEATTGTATTARSISAKVLNDKINAVVTANAYSHPTYTAKTSGLYKITVDSTGHISATSAVTKADITGLGIPAQDTTYTLSSFDITATATELNYCDGVTSNIQTQLNNKLSSTGTASKATADANGNTITSTYATKTEVNNGLAGKLSTSGGNITGHIYLTGAQENSSTANTSQIIFGTDDNNHIAISSNTNAIIINPDKSSTTNQIVLYLDKPSLFPSGISANLYGNANTATKATQDASGNNIVNTYAKKSDVYTKAEVDALIASVVSNAMWRGNAPS